MKCLSNLLTVFCLVFLIFFLPSLVPNRVQAEDAGMTLQAASKPGFDITGLDRTCKPCQDFNQFAVGGWLARTSIPPEYPSWGRGTELEEKNLEVLHQILEAAARNHRTILIKRRCLPEASSSPPGLRSQRSRRTRSAFTIPAQK